MLIDAFGPFVLYLLLANGTITVTPGIETLQQCLNHGNLLIAADPARYTIREPICLPVREPRGNKAPK